MCNINVKTDTSYYISIQIIEKDMRQHDRVVHRRRLVRLMKKYKWNRSYIYLMTKESGLTIEKCLRTEMINQYIFGFKLYFRFISELGALHFRTTLYF